MSHQYRVKFGRCGLFGLAAAMGALASACDSPGVFLPYEEFGGHAGVLDGTVTYSGPLPCTESQRVVGAAALLAFNVRLLPPPEGLGTSAASLAIVPGETLFAGVRSQLTFNADGSRWCPPPPSGKPGDTVAVSTDWAISPLPPGSYQVRGFYDLDGSFDPGFSISNLPTKGDIGGGAIENTAKVLLKEESVRYRELTLPPSDKGSRISGIAVTLGLPIPLNRPVFFPQAVNDKYGTNTDPTKIVMPSDFQFEVFTVGDAVATEESFLSVTLGAGVPSAEVEKAKEKPFNFPVPGSFFYFSRQDVNGDGDITSIDHIPETGVVPAMYPLSIFSKLADGSDLHGQSAPAIVIQGLTIWKSLDAMGKAMADNPMFQPKDKDMGMEAVSNQVKVGVRPAALCLHVADPTRPGLLVVSHETDRAKPEAHKIISDEALIADALAQQFGRPVTVAYGCLPEGRYAMNLVYETGQAWTVPNEAAVCAPSEPPNAAGTECGTRARLPSQGVVLTVGPPTDPSYCSSVKDAEAIKKACSASP